MKIFTNEIFCGACEDFHKPARFPNVSRGTLVKKLTSKIIKKVVDKWGVRWYNKYVPRERVKEETLAKKN